MKIRRYLGSNTQEAILKVKMDLGNEALILNTRKVRKKGLFKIFSKPMVEVLAAIDEDYGSKRKEPEAPKAPEVPIRETKPTVAPVERQEKNNFDKKEEKISELENKVNNMEALLQKIYHSVQPEEVGEEKSKAAEKPAAEAKTAPAFLQLFESNLIRNEVEPELIKQIFSQAAEKIGPDAGMNETASAMYSVVSNLLGKPEILKQREDGKPTVVILVGPTGVGKTTTLAKIAANFSLNMKKSVGLITADTYRIAAVEQLKTYAEILGMPVSVIYSAAEMKEAIEAYSDKDVILIDTAGRSHRNAAQFEELKTLVAESGADEIYLVLSATTSISNCKEILSHYSFMKDYRLIFTKMDEAPVAGIIINTRTITGKNLSYVTIGQSVPDDIEVVNVDKITKMLLGSMTQ